MNVTSARSRAAPAPHRTANRAPEIFAARSKSRMPSAGPRSQCACGSKSNAGVSPQLRSTRFAVSSGPTGTDSCGRFGIASSSCSTSLASAVAVVLRRRDLRAERCHAAAERLAFFSAA